MPFDVFSALDAPVPEARPIGDRDQIGLIKDNNREGKPVVVAILMNATEANLKKLHEHSELLGVYLECFSRPVGSLKHLKPLKHLRVLKVHGDMLTLENLKVIHDLGLFVSKEAGPENLRDRPAYRPNGNGIFRAPPVPLFTFPIHSNVTSLSLAQLQLTDLALRQFTGLPDSIKTLKLKYGPTSDELLITLAELNLLHRWEECTTKDRGRPTTLADVHTIALHQTKATGRGLKELKALTGLRRISISKEDLTDDHLQTLTRLGKLHTLEQARSAKGGYPETSRDVTSFNHDKGTILTDTGLGVLKEFENLESLVISGHSFTSDGFQELAGLTRLRSLQISCVEPSDSIWKPLSHLRMLEKLTVYGSKHTCAGISSLGELKHLGYLNLQGTSVGNAELKEIAQLKSLTSLNLMNTMITDQGLTELCALPALETLAVAGTNNTFGTKVTDAWVKPITDIASLKTVWLIGDVSPDAIDGLKRARPQLTIKK